MNNKGIGLIHVILGVLWLIINAIYALILFFPVSVEINSYPPGAEVFVSSKRVGETPMKLQPIPPEGSWITIFKVEHIPFGVEYEKELRGGIYGNLLPADHFVKIEVGIARQNVAYVTFIPPSAETKKLTMDEHGGFFQLLDERLKESEEKLKQFLMNCYSEKQIEIKHI
ncbi:MAG: hypothetical protein PVH61_27630 [Candidatus Aminicenantes bacterium]|jgi:hypothetical protein